MPTFQVKRAIGSIECLPRRVAGVVVPGFAEALTRTEHIAVRERPAQWPGRDTHAEVEWEQWPANVRRPSREVFDYLHAGWMDRMSEIHYGDQAMYFEPTTIKPNPLAESLAEAYGYEHLALPDGFVQVNNNWL